MPQPHNRTRHALQRVALTLTLLALTSLALALPPTINYDRNVSLNTGPDGASLTSLLEALALTSDATLLIHDIPDTTIRYTLTQPRPMREIWDLLTTLHNLDYLMRDDHTIIVAPHDTLERFQPPTTATTPERRDHYYSDQSNAELAASIITSRYSDATVIAFPQHQLLLINANNDTHDSIQAFLDDFNRNLAQHAPNASASETSNAATSDNRTPPSSDTPPQPSTRAERVTRVDFYHLGADADGFAEFVTNEHPSARVMRVNDEGVLAITATHDEHEQLMVYLANFRNPINARPSHEHNEASERAFALIHQQATSASEQLTSSLGEHAERVTITPNERTNTILVRGDANVISQAERILAVLDQRLPQVMLTMRVTEINEREAQRLGINLTGSIGALAVNLISGGLNLILDPLAGLTSLTLGATLDALEQQGLARTVDEISLRVNHNHEASFKSGGQIQVQLADEVVTIDFGSQMSVRPLISPDGTITLDIQSTLSDFAGALSGVTGLQLSERDLNTSVSFHHDDVVILGGILRNSLEVVSSGPPILRNIPILGWLFNSTEKSEESSDFIILLSAEIID